MTEPAESAAATTPAGEPPNPFLTPDSAWDPSQSRVAQRDADAIEATPVGSATPRPAAAGLGRRGSGRTSRRRRGHRLGAALAVALATAMVLGVAIHRPAGTRPRDA